MSEVLQLVLLGLGTGALYALGGFGLVVVFRSSGVVNFAHAATGSIGSFAFFELSQQHGWAVVPAAVVGTAASAAVGLASYGAVMLLPRSSATVTRVIASLAMLLILQAAVTLHYNSDARVVGDYLPTGLVDFGGGISVSADRLILLGVAVVLAMILTVVYRSTRFGLATTAVAESPRNLAALGWRVGVLRSVNWALGGALAGIGTVLLSPILGVSAVAGVLLIVPILAAALIGGMSSFWLTLVGGSLIGVLQAVLGRHNAGIQGVADAVPLLVIIGVLLIRGRGIPVRGALGERLPAVANGHVPLVGLVLAVVLASSWLLGASADWAGAATTTIATATIVLSLTVVLGYAGQLSLAQVTLAGVGALIAAKLAHGGMPLLVAMAVGILGTIPVGVLIGLPSLRTRGVSLAVATLGLAVAVNALLFSNADISGGSLGISIVDAGSLSIGGWDIDALLYPGRYAIFTLTVFVIVATLVVNLRRGRSGRRMLAVRGNERAAAALGVDVTLTKLAAFAIGSGIAATGGILVAYRNPNVLLTQYDTFDNISAVAFAVVGGTGSVLGALTGGLLQESGIGSTVLSDLSSGWAKYLDLIGGLLLLLTVVTVPDGAAPAAADALRRLGRRVPSPVRRLWVMLTVGAAASDIAPDGAPLAVEPRALEVRDLSVRFGGVRALSNVSLVVRPGEVVSLIGPNGAGKSTFVDAVTGFVRGEGQVLLGGVDVSGASVHARARLGISRSFQGLELFDDMTVLENLRCADDEQDVRSFAVDLVRPARGTIGPAARAVIRTFELAPILHRRPTALSFGERRMVAIARSVAAAPSVLLLDEPCAGLGHGERDEVAAAIRMLAREHGVAVLLIEHDVELVREVSDRLVVLDYGEVIACGDPAEVLQDRRVVEAYLGTLEPAEPEPTADEVVA